MAVESGEGGANLCDFVSDYAAAKPSTLRADGTWDIKNYDVFNLFYLPEDVEEFWKSHRRLEFFLVPTLPLLSMPTYFIVAFLDLELAGGPVEWFLFMYSLCTAIPSGLLVNIDALILGSSSFGRLSDFIFMAVAVILLGLYGEGFYLIGIMGLIASWLALLGYYAIVAHQLLNSKGDPGIQRQHEIGNKIAMFGIVACVLCGRGLIFMQKWTVANDEIANISGRVLTIRDIWVALVDIVYIRAAYAGFDLLTRGTRGHFHAYSATAKLVEV
mmetsp:Transcript_10175/g.11712  ORF Transcript_10175/g.11712 Transcript_10175/m.11712 type:complete len:272 (+) Transcript_10175:149-964(+)|eukprot:CAMPEP_0184009122 /NCGR_PEP_ID=MMETSP0954-20121128/2406_1 /TAXON_ID=627963 /ORGANISM="Aplanochytrium sp, Strain PBS07" /LENGTH=271 /DNA_ID=CAMNT_0026288413 /DNA_START=100 /DNA_END=915 /DNA_ORIENTATION=-